MTKEKTNNNLSPSLSQHSRILFMFILCSAPCTVRTLHEQFDIIEHDSILTLYGIHNNNEIYGIVTNFAYIYKTTTIKSSKQ